jgi:hypothetical protein
MSGNHGDISLGGYHVPTTVHAAPGQTPVLTSLYASANKWVFNGITVPLCGRSCLDEEFAVENDKLEIRACERHPGSQRRAISGSQRPSSSTIASVRNTKLPEFHKYPSSMEVRARSSSGFSTKRLTRQTRGLTASGSPGWIQPPRLRPPRCHAVPARAGWSPSLQSLSAARRRGNDNRTS